MCVGLAGYQVVEQVMTCEVANARCKVQVLLGPHLVINGGSVWELKDSIPEVCGFGGGD